MCIDGGLKTTCQADQTAGKRRQVRQAEEGGAEEQEGCRQGEEVRLVDTKTLTESK